MKIDLYNNYETYRQETKQNRLITRGYRDFGLTAKDIEQHPCFADIAILVNIRNTYWHIMNQSEKGIWSGCWSNAYNLRRFIRPKTLNKLYAMTECLHNREQLLEQQRQRIKALRSEPLKRDQDNEANGSHSHSSHTWTVAYESATDCPYF